MQQRLDVLGWDIERFRVELNNVSCFDTEKRENQLRTTRAWLKEHPPGHRRPGAGRSGDGRAREDDRAEKLWRILAEAEPPDPTLPGQIELIRSFVEGGVEDRYYAFCLARALERGLDDPEPKLGSAPEAKGDTARAWLAATQLVAAALAQSGDGRSKTIYIDAPGFDTTLLERGIGAIGPEWQSTLRRALDAGWTVLHVVSCASTTRQVLHPAVQADLMLNLLYASTAEGEYTPILHAPGGHNNVVAVEDHGAVGIWEVPATDGTARKVSCQLHHGECGKNADSRAIANALITKAETLTCPAGALPTFLFHPHDDHYNTLRFDMALAAEEAESNARHAMVKAWPPVVTVPEELWERHTDKWYETADPELFPYVALHHQILGKRRNVFLAATESAMEPWRYRDIVTVQGIEAYLHADPEQPEAGGGARWGLKHLDVDERREHVRHLATLVRQRPGYDLALVDQKALLVPVHPTWWATIAGDTPGVGAVFFLALRTQGLHQGWLYDSESTNVVDGFMSLFQGLWETLPNDSRAPASVAARLEGLAEG